MRLAAMVLALAPALVAAKAPPPVLSPEQATEELARLHAQVAQLKSQLARTNDGAAALKQQLDGNEARAQAFREQVTELQNRGATNEQARRERFRALDDVTRDAVQLDYLLTRGSDDLDGYFEQLQGTLEQARASAASTGGQLELQGYDDALLALSAARESAEGGDYFTARGFLDEVVSYAHDAQTAAGANPMREWTGQ